MPLLAEAVCVAVVPLLAEAVGDVVVPLLAEVVDVVVVPGSGDRMVSGDIETTQLP